MRRRDLLTLTATTAALAACSSPGSTTGSTPGSPPSPAGWSATGGFGRTLTLDARPERVVTDAYSAAALWDHGVRPVGVFGYGLEEDASPLALGNVDLDGIDVVGRGGELNIEALAALQPDLVVGFGTTRGQGWAWWEEGTTTAVANIAPFLAVEFSGRSVEDVIGTYGDLAEDLGGDRSATDADRARYTENVAALQDVADPALRTIALNGDASALYAGTPALAQLKLLADHGVTLVGPAASAGSPWAELSWENVSTHPADVLLAYVGSQELFAGSPVYASLPAVQAGQVVEWDDKQPFTYGAYADWLERVVATFTAARDVTA
ncbi:ABC transporter substrate-binding protein [Kineococcus sp. SYSU DK001]|uniref:ABC transporter substrate-binding protein n=1 Tax=Kineococcus sp. SYSU DK001 TaxID=3383122 RepID=UPI003D7EDFF1